MFHQKNTKLKVPFENLELNQRHLKCYLKQMKFKLMKIYIHYIHCIHIRIQMVKQASR